MGFLVLFVFNFGAVSCDIKYLKMNPAQAPVRAVWPTSLQSHLPSSCTVLALEPVPWWTERQRLLLFVWALSGKSSHLQHGRLHPACGRRMGSLSPCFNYCSSGWKETVGCSLRVFGSDYNFRQVRKLLLLCLITGWWKVAVLGSCVLTCLKGAQHWTTAGQCRALSEGNSYLFSTSLVYSGVCVTLHP